jgi:hypothetical protein
MYMNTKDMRDSTIGEKMELQFVRPRCDVDTIINYANSESRLMAYREKPRDIFGWQLVNGEQQPDPLDRAFAEIMLKMRERYDMDHLYAMCGRWLLPVLLTAAENGYPLEQWELSTEVTAVLMILRRGNIPAHIFRGKHAVLGHLLRDGLAKKIKPRTRHRGGRRRMEVQITSVGRAYLRSLRELGELPSGLPVLDAISDPDQYSAWNAECQLLRRLQSGPLAQEPDPKPYDSPRRWLRGSGSEQRQESR